MDAGLDLDAYLARIGWHGPVRRDREGVAALLRAHMRYVPFENLSVLLGEPVRLDLASLQDKIVQRRRGGYCFEQVSLFAAVLEALGFAPARHSARVVRYVPREQAPRTHMFLTLALPDGRILLDPGLGGAAPEVPLPVRDSVSGGRDGHWLEREGPLWKLRMRQDGADADLWLSSMEEDPRVDFEVANHYTSTHPESIFRTRLLLRSLTPQGRVTVLDRELTVRNGNQEQRRELADRAELRKVVQTWFGFDLPQIETLRVPAIEAWR